MTMKRITYWLTVLLVSAQGLAHAQDIALPTIKAGDSWTYRITTEKGANGWNQTRDDISVSRVTASAIYFTSKQSGSTQAPLELLAGRDWSRMRDVNGKETLVNRPLAFPLSTGKTWDLLYEERHPNKAHKLEKWDNKFTVIGYENVDVPAGKFKALKIESEGKWMADLEPTQTVVQGAQAGQSGATMISQVQRVAEATVSGRTYKAFWYVPEIKRWVKSVEEYYGTGGVRNERYTAELESFKLAD